jgi:hypothetical protein
LNKRIADVRRCIEDAERHDSQFWMGSDRVEILALLYSTLKSLEAQKAALAADREV